jgi:hypothetical protein
VLKKTNCISDILTCCDEYCFSPHYRAWKSVQLSARLMSVSSIVTIVVPSIIYACDECSKFSRKWAIFIKGFKSRV